MAPRRLVRGRNLVVRRRAAAMISPPVFAARAAPVPAAPDPNPQPAVRMGVLSHSTPPLPPQPAAHAAVRLGAFADPPPAPRTRLRAPAPRGLRLGDFGAVSAPARAAPARREISAVQVGGFRAAFPATTPVAVAVPVAPPRVETGVLRSTAAPAPRSAPAPAPAPLAGYQPPVILFKPQPVYPAAARARGLEGLVVLRVALTASGRVRVLAVEHGLGPLLDRAARQAALRIRFRPARRRGRAVDAVVRIRVRFRVAD